MPYDNEASSSGVRSELAEAYYKWLGIPVSEQPANAYRLLGSALFEPNGDVIQAAADRQMAHVRTYQTGKHGAISQQMLNELAAAKLSLLRPEKRVQYDQTLRQQLFPAAAPVPQVAPVFQPAPIPLRIPEAAPPVVVPQSNLPDGNPFDAITEMDRAAPFGSDSPGFATRKSAAAISTQIRRAKTSSIAVSIGIAVAGIVAVVVAIVIVNGAPQDDSPAAARPEATLAHAEPPKSNSHHKRMQAQLTSREQAPGQRPTRTHHDPSSEFDGPTLPDMPTLGEVSGRQVSATPVSTSPALVAQPPVNQADNLPKLNQPALVLPTDHVGSEQLDLAPGTHFNVAIFHIDRDAISDVSDKENKSHGVVYLKFGNDKFEYVGFELHGFLDGIALIQDAKGEPAEYAEYLGGQLNGNLMGWRTDGTRLLFAQFLHGDKHGFLCFFDSQGALCLIQEFKRDQPMWSYLIRNGVVTRSFSHLAKKAIDDKELTKAASDADTAALQLRGSFRKVKMAAAEYDEQQRRDLAARNSVAARARIMERNSERDSAHSAAISALRKWSGL